jgi:hypothetical protein
VLSRSTPGRVLVATSALLYSSVGVVPRVARSKADPQSPVSPAPPRGDERPRWIRRVAIRLSALLADDGMSARFAAERQRDDDLVRRVERRRHL